MTDIPNGAVFETGSGFSIGNVIERSFSVFGRNFVPLMILSAISASPYIIVFWMQADILLALPNGTNSAAVAPDKAMHLMKEFGISSAISFVVGFFVSTVGRVALIAAVFRSMRGLPVDILASVRQGLARFFPVIGMSILMGLGIFAGSLLLIVPGIMLYTAWYVALAACVVEGLGPARSLGRSAALTKGSRWKIFGLVFLIAIVGGIVSATANGVFTAGHSRVIFTVGEYLMQTLMFAIQSIIALVVYHDLRVSKEGIDTDRIASVFE